jgi:hypothetical protein
MCSLGGENTLFHTSISTRLVVLFFYDIYAATKHKKRMGSTIVVNSKVLPIDEIVR